MKKWINKNVVFNWLVLWGMSAALFAYNVTNVWAWVIAFLATFVILTFVRAALQVFVLGDKS